jgi:alkylhydroperoxidase family enzyme
MTLSAVGRLGPAQEREEIAMARLPYFERDDLPPEYQSMMDHPSNLNRIFGNSPACRQAHHAMAKYIRFGTKLDPRLREMVILEVGYLSRAEYEWAHHIKLGHDFGVTDDDITKLIAFNDGKQVDLDSTLRTVLEGVREMVVGGAMSSATFEKLRAILGNTLLLDLIMVVAHYSGVVKMLGSLELDVEENYKRYLDKFPLPPKSK